MHDYYSKFIIYGKVKTEFVWIKDFLLFCERIFIYTKGKSEILRARFNCTVKSRPYNRLSIPILLSTQTVLYYYFYMYRALTHPKLLRRLPHRGLVLDDIICDLNRPLLNIILQEKSPCIVRFYNLCRGKGSYSRVTFTIPKIPPSSFHPSWLSCDNTSFPSSPRFPTPFLSRRDTR